eukprot:gnl/MRDRNA2_/MRDRNA2_351214_c0_seq1.p1 gnl/MRDRNA2_/MRDRNA2_351214_c0~~gnl/MRDRNA2_/MRDRNA2_351214_c0_seq1.p1  ORF type:complete len:227 (+),score=40.68 gnl/MRDRNA2_/MRDRNA2_351214_c0_seq1:1-681(+)
MSEVLQDMVTHNTRWSELTAMRAVFTSARIVAGASSAETMTKVLQSWLQRPICTSVIIIFWQRYLCRLAAEHAACQSEHVITQLSLDWIMRWIPLKADCVLPGDLTDVLSEVGWVRIISMPQLFVPVVLTVPTRDKQGSAEEQGQSTEVSQRGKLAASGRKGSEDETVTGSASSDPDSPRSLSEGSFSESMRPCKPPTASDSSCPQAPNSGSCRTVVSNTGTIECL